jgi:hypothetical protein
LLLANDLLKGYAGLRKIKTSINRIQGIPCLGRSTSNQRRREIFMKKSKLFQSWGTFRKGLDAQSIQLSFASHLEYSLSNDQFTATNRDLYQALALSARDRLIERWIKTQQKYYTADV